MAENRSSVVSRAARALEMVVRFVDRLAEGFVVLLFAGIVLVGGLQVVSRYIFNASLAWSEEFQRYGLIWMVFLALVIGYRRGSHIGMEFLARKLPGCLQTGIGWAADFLWLALGVAMLGFTAFYRSAAGMTFLASVGRQRSAGMGMPMDWVYACIVVGGAYLTLAALNNLLQRATGSAPAIAAEDTEP